MDIVRAFSDSGLSHGVAINIQGTADDPLFQANQIGEMLGLINIRETIKDFDADEKDAVSTTDAIGRRQTVLFLTEVGLIRLLGLSRKPIARPFQKWVAKVVREIRLAGKYELENRLVQASLASQEHETALALAAKEKDDAVAELAVRDSALASKDAELAAFRSKTYEELPRLDTIYVNKEIAELSSNTHKIGRSIDAKKREAQLNTGSAQGSRMIYTRFTHNAKIVEDMCRVALKRYHIATLGGVEHYSCSIDHSVDVIDLACTVMDTMASSFEYITRRDLYKKCLIQLRVSMGDEDSGSDDDDGGSSSSSSEAEDARVIKARDFVEANINFRPVRTAEFAGRRYYAWVTEKELMSRFWLWYISAVADNDEFRRGVDKAMDSKRAWKTVLRVVMEAKGRTATFIQPGGVGCNAYDKVAFTADP